MRKDIPRWLAREVRLRAKGVCEYCRLPQSSQEATFHIDHVVPLAAKGDTSLENLALACTTCSLKKGARIAARDPKSGKLVPVFSPRAHDWSSHFRWSADFKAVGKTSTGRATIALLGMNRPAILAIRQVWAQLGVFPPA
ncbi:MAG: HNH endonuclease [Gemmataceae bacterium]|nr:HNH endonuclease [Gemmataceae bacterium]